MNEPTGDEEETIRQYETAQARHDTDYNPTTKEPQSLKNPNSALPATRYPLRPHVRTPRGLTIEILSYAAFNASCRRRATTKNAPGPYGT